jgi:hypothetical protein
MIDMALDPKTGDLLLIEASAVLVDQVDQIAQNLAIRLRFIQGEWYLNILAGIPYFQYFFVKEPNQIQVESFLKDEIVNTRGVEEITSFSSDYNSAKRTFGVQFSVKSLSGIIEIDQELP